MFDILVILFLAALVGVAFFKNSSLLRIFAVVVLVAALMLREESIYAYLRPLMGGSSLTGAMRDHFRDGALAIVDYCKVTSV